MFELQGGTSLLKLQVPAASSIRLDTCERQATDVSVRCDGSHVTKLTNFFGEFCLEEVDSCGFSFSCEHAQLRLTGPPVVFLVRDHSQMGHFLTVQVAPLIAVRMTT